MISSSEFRSKYEKFYQEMRNYLWDIYTLQLLADVQMCAYTTFVDANDLKLKLEKLYMAIRQIAKDDEYLQEAYDDFYNLVEDNLESDYYYNLYQVEEV